MAVHPEYIRIFTALSSHSIQHCMLRDEISHGQLVGDLDLLVDERRKDDVLAVLKGLGYYVKTGERYLPFKSVLVKFSEEGFIVIDLHYRIVQNGIVMLNTRKVLQSIESKDEYNIPADEDLLAILILHNILGKEKIQEKHVPTIKKLLAQIDPISLRDRLEVISSIKIAELILRVIQDLDEHRAAPERLAIIRTELRRLYVQFDPGLQRRLRRRRLMLFWRRWSPVPRAPMYAMTGVDGVGKSSLNDALLAVLNQPGGFPAVSEYMGPWGHYRLKCMKGELFSPGWSLTSGQWLRAMLRRNSENRFGLGTSIPVIVKMARGQSLSDEEQQVHDHIRTSSRLFLTLRYLRSLYAAASFMLLLTVEMYYRYFLVYKYRRRGITVIADRYIYDLMTGRMHEYIPQYRRLRSFLCWVFPKPTQVFLLHNDPDIILRRKDDLSEAVLHQFMALYDELATKYGFEKVRTDKPPEILANEIVASHFAEIVAGVRT